jgi:hypothetical protein
MRLTSMWALVVVGADRFDERASQPPDPSGDVRAEWSRRRRTVDGPFVETKEWVLGQDVPAGRRLTVAAPCRRVVMGVSIHALPVRQVFEGRTRPMTGPAAPATELQSITAQERRN